MARINAIQAGGKNVLAFLDMLAWSELGAEMLKQSDDGYNLTGGSLPGRLITASIRRHSRRVGSSRVIPIPIQQPCHNTIHPSQHQRMTIAD